MEHANTPPKIGAPAPPPIPDPQKLQPPGLSDKHKRWIYYGVTAVILLLILANVIGSNQTGSAKVPATRAITAQQQNPTPAQIRDWENNLKQTEAQLQEETKNRQQQLDVARAEQQLQPQAPMTADDLQRAAALQDAAQARAQFQQGYGASAGPGGQSAAQQSQLQTQTQEKAYKSLFADNVVHQQSVENGSGFQQQNPQQAGLPPQAESPESPEKPVAEKERKGLDFDPAAQKDYWLPEGTLIEAVLTNRLDGDAPGPVNSMITTDVYLPGTRLVLIPQGARVLGEASKVSSFGQQRLAVAFHRIIIPGLRTYSIPLDKEPPALAQAGEVGLHDKVNNHYFSIFGASLAVGAIGGLAQIGNGYSGFGYDPSVQFRNGVSQNMAQSSDRILDRFLNRMPTVTIREGTRVKILLTGDLQFPAYASMHTGDM